MPFFDRQFNARHDPEGFFLDASASSEHVVGRSPEELVGSSVYDLFHPDDLGDMVDEHRLFLRDGGRRVINARVRHRDGHFVWLEVEVIPKRDPATGLVTEFETTSVDVGARFAAARAGSSRQLRSTDFERVLD